MSLVAPVVDGKIQETTSKTSETTSTTSNSTLDKQAFLQLLVAQMKYQDPLEPTSNTEYISQLATFSTLEEMQNMRSSMDLQRASALVGQEVYVKTTDSSTGDTELVYGKVDYVQYENNKAYLSIDGSLYSVDDLYSVYDEDYMDATVLAYNWTVGLNQLPALSKVTLSDEEDIMELKDTLDNMTTYQLSFITDENKEKLQDYVDRIKLLKAAAEEAEKEAEKETGTEGAASDTETDTVENDTETDTSVRAAENGTETGTSVNTAENNTEAAASANAAESGTENDGAVTETESGE